MDASSKSTSTTLPKIVGTRKMRPELWISLVVIILHPVCLHALILCNKNVPTNLYWAACGEYQISSANSTVKPPPWNVYVHTNGKTCTGTIVASNLVVTSHVCLLLENQSHMRLVDFLKFQNGKSSVAHIKDITITESKDKSGETYKVLDVMYNPQFVLSSERQHADASKYLEDDLVLLKVDANFLSGAHKLICIPPYKTKVEAKDQTGLYYSYVKDSYSRDDSNTADVLWGPVSKKKSCLANPKSKDPTKDTMLCIKHEDDLKERMEGGPLIVTSSSQNSFLIGISAEEPDSNSLTGRDASTGLDYDYFTAVAPLVRFIEHFSKRSGSKWCRTAKFTVTSSHGSHNGDGEGEEVGGSDESQRAWPWENRAPAPRDEVLDCKCGIPNTKIWGRVVGGVEATPREYGWMALVILHPNGRGKGSSLCGGSVITDRLILTAAHCIVDDHAVYDGKSRVAINPANVDVTLMAHDRNNDPEGIRTPVSAVLFHPQYINGRLAAKAHYDADVALLVLKEPLHFPAKGPGIRPICLHKYGEYEEVVGRNAWVVGWGLTDPKDKSSAANKLQKLEIPIAELKFCSDVATSIVTDNSICAGTLDMYKDAAAGDSGGPLQLEDRKKGQWYQVGAVSWGEDVPQRGGKTKTAALYADVQKLLPFIDYHAKRLGSKWCRTESKNGTNSDTGRQLGVDGNTNTTEATNDNQ